MKTVLKVLYIAIMLVIGAILSLGMYNTYTSEGYVSILNNAITTADETGNYDDLFRTFSIYETPLDGTPILEESLGEKKTTLVAYSSVNQYCAKYTENDEEVSFIRVEDVYLIAIVHPTFSKLPDQNGNNSSALEFIGSNGKSYNYLFELSSKYNAGKYIEDPTSEKECALGGYCYGVSLTDITYSERTYLDTYDDFDLIFVPVSESLLGFIKEEVGSDITALNIIDNNGNEVFAEDVSAKLDFSQEFFTDAQNFVYNYNRVQEYSNGTDDTITKADAQECADYLEAFREDPDSVIPDYTSKYLLGYAQTDIYDSAKVMWKCIGIFALFAVVAALLFILLFYFKKIRSFIYRLAKKEEPENTTPRIPKPINLDTTPKPVLTASGVKRSKELEDMKKKEALEAEAPEEVKTEEPVTEVKPEEPVIEAEEVKTLDSAPEEASNEAEEAKPEEPAIEEVKEAE